ncbi:MAG: hypothetical protein ACFB15_13305 [Cyclobacteriaceae bacterium]
MNRNLRIQEYLSLGYIYLLALGILSDTIYYRFLGITILEYSGIQDVLLSPIVLLTSNFIVPISLVVLIGIFYLWTFKLAPQMHLRYREKRWYRKLNNIERLDKKYATPTPPNTIATFVAMAVLIFYLGIGVGRGNKVRNQIKSNDIEASYKVLFHTGEEESVKVVGQNSLYLFYIGESDTELIIAPIENNIKKIIQLEEDN